MATSTSPTELSHNDRVCDRCAERRARWDHAVTYAPENVAAAKDERARRLGGQRNLAGEYE